MKHVLILVLMLPQIAMSEIFIEEHNSVSGRYAVLEDNGSSAWLYLTPTSGEGIEKDAFVYSPVKPHEGLDKKSIEEGNPPVLIQGVASNFSILESANQNDFSFLWSQDGHSVSVMHKGSPLAMIIASQKEGYSKSLVKYSFFGHPWDQTVFDTVFVK